MNLKPFKGPGSTPSRRRFWDTVTQAVIASQKVAGQNVTVDEHPGMGSVINVPDSHRGRGGGGGGATGACCVGSHCYITSEADCIAAGGAYQGDNTLCVPNPCDFSTCDNLPPVGPGPPTHINIVRTLSGSCGDVTYSGSVTYDLDLGFGLEGPVGGHFFCAHNIFDNGFGEFWTGHFTGTCAFGGSTDFGGNGYSGLYGRDTGDGSWWFQMGGISGGGGPVGTCDGCFFTFLSIFEEVAGPTGTFIFTDTDSGVTLTTTVTVT